MAKTGNPQSIPQASISLDAPDEGQGVDICPQGNVFICRSEGVALTGEGGARMYSALDGIHTITAILFQRELDRSCEGGIVVSENAAMGLLNALGSCTELAQCLLKGWRGYSRAIDTSSADYAALDRFVKGVP